MSSTKRSQPAWHAPHHDPNVPVLKVNNSLASAKVEFVPAHGRQVSWYICGPTVYDSSHMGHARNYVTFDIIRRILEDYFNYDLFSVMNITDVDDKIILKARRNYLFAEYQSKHPTLTDEVIQDVQSASETLQRKLAKKIEEEEAKLNDPETHKKKRVEIAAKIKLFKQKLEKAKNDDAKHLEEAKKALQNNSNLSSNDLLTGCFDSLSETLDDKYGSTVHDQKIFKDHAAKYEAEFMEDMKRLNVRMPDVLTRVTEYIPEIIQYVQKIIDNGFAYESNGSVYFDTVAFDNSENHFYAKLQPWSVGDKELAEEGEGQLSLSLATEKKNPNDFALWKKSKPGEPRWDSPWGQGRPGWHIECSAMASDLLGRNIDIHSGGQDLRFPHHDNELAQSEAHFGCDQWVNYFLHSGHLHIDGLKMSKSLKNFFTIRETLKVYTPRQIRMLFLLQPWDNVMLYSADSMEEVKNKEKSFKEFFTLVESVVREQGNGTQISQKWGEREKVLNETLIKAQEQVHKCLCDNFDTAGVMQQLSDLVTTTNKYCMKNTERKALLVHKVAVYVTKIFRIFGLVSGEQEFGFGREEETVAGEGGVDKVAILAPVLNAFTDYRAKIRQAAKEKKEHSVFLSLSDQVRDDIMPELGVRFEDEGEFPWKLDSPEQLIKERDEKKRAAARIARQKLEKSLQALKRDLEKWEKAQLPPQEYFKAENKYSQFNEAGMPTHDIEGKELTKTAMKKVEKEFEWVDKAHKAFQKALAEDSNFMNALREKISNIENRLREMPADDK
eukprot:GEZU01029287.1.p1 GENE.GEZU01029287.1~~GEZU01029287.1.p1  ORF type:complete len:781 (+),score=306.65 GEZU01029287.1:102-2444(+)